MPPGSGQVGRRSRPPRWRDQLGRLLARRARPKAKNKAAAIALVNWLSDKEQQVTMWTSKKQGGHFPSNQQAAEDPAVKDAKSAYFSNAPVGADLR